MITIDSLEIETADRETINHILMDANIDESLYWVLIKKMAELVQEYYLMDGYVYIIYAGMGLYKIGMTKRQTEIRLSELEETRIVKIIRTDHPKILETQLHNKFEERRLIKGQELFELRDTDLFYIYSLEGITGSDVKESSLLDF